MREWEEYLKQEPWGPTRDDWRFAQFYTDWLNLHAGRGGTRHTIRDVLKKRLQPFGQPPRKQEQSTDERRRFSQQLSAFMSKVPGVRRMTRDPE